MKKKKKPAKKPETKELVKPVEAPSTPAVIPPKPEGYLFGRPTSYTPDMPERVLTWLSELKDTVELMTVGEGIAPVMRPVVKLPSAAALAGFLNVTKSTLYDWAEKYPDFSYALKRVHEEQERRLLDCGLNGNYNSTISKLVLSSNHGYREKEEKNVNMNLKAEMKNTSFSVHAQLNALKSEFDRRFLDEINKADIAGQIQPESDDYQIPAPQKLLDKMGKVEVKSGEQGSGTDSTLGS